jgi:hypothetical protein
MPEDDSGDYQVYFNFGYVKGVKTLTYGVLSCNPPLNVELFVNNGFAVTASNPCIPIRQNATYDFSGVFQLVLELKDWANGQPNRVVYKNRLVPVREAGTPLLPTEQPVAPPDPSMILLDGLSGNILQLDLTTATVMSQVAPPQTANGPLAARPTITGSANEVWVANGWSQVTVLDMSAGTVAANIPTPSVPSGATPAGIVFDNSGEKAFEAFRLSSPDASGNSGLLVVFDAVNRLVTFSLPLKYAPAAFLMAPDGLTAYLLSTRGEITYYDVLSGTADLSASTYTPGFDTGYNGFSNVFVHPDGTRLFWAVGPNLESFDLTQRKVTAQFSSGLPTTSAITLEVSQNGSFATMSNGQGNGVVLDTHYGIIQYKFQSQSPTLYFPGS